ncbi:hypothetical protein FRC04_004942 [Tulasnella sp. 424]|nr:hypothetical protein FRC04_004942 [Tulasnella sp. 424]KAG8970194.1 hypothetical protein FRC05_000715 [Tulasnella sp. 425]
MHPAVRTSQQSPILNLPDDLTYLIFLTCHHDDPERFSTVILRVCSQWRQTALAIPELWSTINFDKNLKEWQVVERIQLQLERAQLAPLHIHIFEPAIHKPAVKNMLKICQLILPLIQRWGSLTIQKDIPHRTLRLLFDRLANTSAPWLERLTIQNRVRWWDPDVDKKWKFKAFGGGMPSLRYLQLSRCTFDWNSHMFDNLIDLEIHDPRTLTMNQEKVIYLVRDILIRSPRLRCLVITGDFRQAFTLMRSRARPPPLRETITHSAIKRINVPLCTGRVTDALLELVKMPELEELTREPSYYILPFSFHTLARVNPLSNIRCIRIDGFADLYTLSPQESAALPLALQAMHLLEELVLRTLDLSPSDSWLPNLLTWLPRLKYLKLLACIGLSAPTIREMLDRGRNLKRLTLALYSKVKTEGELIHSRDSPLHEFTSILRSCVGTLDTW